MATHDQPPAPDHTTISDLDDDLIREILLRLPGLPSLVRATVACRAFLRAVRSPAFRGRFLALHPSPILGFFLDPLRLALPEFVPLRRRSDPDLAAVLRGGDLYLTRLPDHWQEKLVDYHDKEHLGWKIHECRDGYVLLFDRFAQQVAAYKPLTKALHLFPAPPFQFDYYAWVDLRIFFSEENQGSFKVFCSCVCDEVPLRAAVFSSETRAWQVLPWPDTTTTPKKREDVPFSVGRSAGFLYWRQRSKPYLTALSTRTLQFSQMDLPPLLDGWCRDPKSTLIVGETRDGNACVAEEVEGDLFVWVWRADDHGIERWEEIYVPDEAYYVQPVAIIGGFVYLHRKKTGHPSRFMSLCVETGELEKLMRYDPRSNRDDLLHPYTMGWPSSLMHNEMNL